MMFRTACVLLAVFPAVDAAMVSMRGAPEADVDFEKLKTTLLGQEVFQQKVTASCANAAQQEECTKKAQDLLVCALLQRSKPEVAAQHCGQKAAAFLQVTPAAAPEVPKAALQTARTSLSDMKSRIMASSDFKHQIEQMSGMLGCNGVKKVDACSGYVQEIAFCLAFADQIDKFATVPGADKEKESCKHVDERLPKLSMLLQQKLSFAQIGMHLRHSKAPEDELAKEMTHDLEMNFNKIAPFGKEDTAKELQDHAAKTQDTLVDAVENAEVAEIKRAVFRALTRLRAATIKEFDTIARLETQAIDAYNDAHHYRAENPLAHLHEDEAPVETDKLKSFH
jgi:hypothetical protein